MRMRRKKNLTNRIESCNNLILSYLFEPGTTVVKFPDPKQCENDSFCLKHGLSSFHLSKLYYGEKNHCETLSETNNCYTFLNTEKPVHLELGAGKGRFINTLAKNNPKIQYFALEKSKNVIVTALEQTKSLEITNLKYIIGLADYLERIFPNNSVDEIYLNFSCPYPKSSYSKRRLTHERYLKIYNAILKPNGVIKQKTDNLPFFEYSISNFKGNNFKVENITYDLHNSNIKGNIITEYEEFFRSKGVTINYLEAYKKND